MECNVLSFRGAAGRRKKFFIFHSERRGSLEMRMCILNATKIGPEMEGDA